MGHSLQMSYHKWWWGHKEQYVQTKLNINSSDQKWFDSIKDTVINVLHF